jgi:steroid delta-isomerase-like uncharacterized protein
MRSHRIVLLALCCAAVAASCSRNSAEQNKAIVSAMIHAINIRDFEAVEALVADDVRRHSSATPGVVVENRDQFIAFLHQDLSVCPDAEQQINLMLAEGDRVAVHATYRGTQSGPMGPYPPSGKRVELPFIGILRVADGKIAEIWVEWDNLHVLSQLGHLPGSTPATEKPGEIEVSGPLPYARLYCDESGASHFADEVMPFTLVDYAPPAPPISVSAVLEAESVAIISSPPGWHGDWHPAPRRQLMFVLAGELEVEVVDGERRRFGPGSAVLVEDTSCKGHISSVVGDERGYMVAVPLRDE